MRRAFLVQHARSHAAAPATAILLWACVAACQGAGTPDGKSENKSAAPALPADVAANVEVNVIGLDGVTGLSGLAADARGALWMVPEREDTLVERPAEVGASPRAWPLTGAPDEDLDLESLAWLGTTQDGRERFAVGTEAICERNTHAVMVVERQGDGFRVVETMRLSLDLWPETVCEDGHGIEGLCAALGPQGEAYVVAAIEHPEQDGQKRRYAPVAALVYPGPGRQAGQAGQRWTPYRVALTSETGKLSALDCRLAPNGIEVWAIERHFEISRLVRFVVPSQDAGAGQPRAQGEGGLIAPTVVMDLSPYTSGGKRNFEGLSIVDGRVHVLVDNQWRTITGPNEILSLPLPAAP
jgi:hypothetical protein